MYKGKLHPDELNRWIDAWVPLYDFSTKIDVSIDRDRYFHSPAMVVAPNGDWLLAHQDSETHVGHDSVIRQVRSVDRGKTWKLDGIVYDGRAEGRLGRGPVYGVTPEGVVILVVQTFWPLSNVTWEERDGYYGDEEGGSIWLTSQNSGETYDERGWVDPIKPERHKSSTGQILEHHGLMFLPGSELTSNPDKSGMNYYTLSDLDKGWQYGEQLFPLIINTNDRNILGYPSIIKTSNGDLTMHCTDNVRVYGRCSSDKGETWGDTTVLEGLLIRNDPNFVYAGDVLLSHGRGMDKSSVVLYFSPDHGVTWGHPIIIEHYGPESADGGYSASVSVGNSGVFIAFSTDGQRHKNPDIRGVFLENVRIRRFQGRRNYYVL
jgi:hypothetical protein